MQLCVFLSYPDFQNHFEISLIEVMECIIKLDACIKSCPCPVAQGTCHLQPILLVCIIINHRKVNTYLSSLCGFCFMFFFLVVNNNTTILLSTPDRRLLSHVWRIWYQGWGTVARFKTVHADSFCRKRLQLLLIFILFSSLLCSKSYFHLPHSQTVMEDHGKIKNCLWTESK